jgi:IS66 Orf2 like protein
MTNGRIEVITTVERRRRWSWTEKQRLVAASPDRRQRVGDCPRSRGSSKPAVWLEAPAARSFANGLCSGADCTGCDTRGYDRFRRNRDRVRERSADADHGRRRSGDIDGGGCSAGRWTAAMIAIPSGGRVWIATGHTDMRRGMNSLTLLVQEAFQRDQHAGDLTCSAERGVR